MWKPACRIVTCYMFFIFKTTDGVVLVCSYHLSTNHHYFAFTFLLYSKICHMKTFRFSNQIKSACREIIKQSKPCAKKTHEIVQYNLPYSRLILLVTSHFTNLLNLSTASASKLAYKISHSLLM